MSNIGTVITRVRGVILGGIATCGLVLPCATFAQATAQSYTTPAHEAPATPNRPLANDYAVNPYSPTHGHAYRHGVVPSVSAWNKMRSWANANPAGPLATGADTLSFGGGIDGIGVVSGEPKVYLVVYGTQWGTQGVDANGNMTFSGDPSGAAPRVQQLFKGLGGGGERWSGTMTQYCDGPLVATGATTCPKGAPHVRYPTNGDLAGIWYDNSAQAPSAATGSQLAQEAINAAVHFGNTTESSNRYAQYVILSPTKTNPDGFPNGGWCAWHDYNNDPQLPGGPVSSTYGEIAFTNLPYITDASANCGENFVNGGGSGLLDGVTIVGGHEYAETLTDVLPVGGWTHNDSGSAEDGDECAWLKSGQGAAQNVTMGTGTFAMQSTWSNDTNECDISHVVVQAPGAWLPAVLSILLQ